MEFYRKSEQIVKRAQRPFSQYAYDIKLKNALTEKENFGFTADNDNRIDNKMLSNGGHVQLWYRDVVELRKKAEEYKVSVAILNVYNLRSIFINSQSSHFVVAIGFFFFGETSESWLGN